MSNVTIQAKKHSDRSKPQELKSNDVGQLMLSEFTPSSYTGNVTATTTVSGQSAAIATGASKLRVRNLDATNYGLIAFGTSAAEAETNAANGCAIEAGQKEIIGIPSSATYFAYLGNTGTVTLNIQQGV